MNIMEKIRDIFKNRGVQSDRPRGASKLEEHPSDYEDTGTRYAKDEVTHAAAVEEMASPVLSPDETTVSAIALLEDTEWKWKNVTERLQKEWTIQGPFTREGERLRFAVGDMRAVCAFVPHPLDQAELDESSRYNRTWPDAARQVQRQQAHTVVEVSGGDDPIARHLLLSTIMSCVLAAPTAFAMYRQPMLVESRQFVRAASVIRDGGLPTELWVFIGLYPTKEKMNAYTYGLEALGRDELEVLDSERTGDELYAFLFDMVKYIIEENVELHDGQRLRLSESEETVLQRSEGLAVQGASMKFRY